MPLHNWVGFTAGVLQSYIATCASTGVTLPNAGSPVMFETRNIPVANLVPRNAPSVTPDDMLQVITDAIAECGFNTSVDVRKPKAIEAWMMPYAVVRRVGRDRVVIDTDDMKYLHEKWPEITAKAEIIARDRDTGRGAPSRVR